MLKMFVLFVSTPDHQTLLQITYFNNFDSFAYDLKSMKCRHELSSYNKSRFKCKWDDRRNKKSDDRPSTLLILTMNLEHIKFINEIIRKY